MLIAPSPHHRGALARNSPSDSRHVSDDSPAMASKKDLPVEAERTPQTKADAPHDRNGNTACCPTIHAARLHGMRTSPQNVPEHSWRCFLFAQHIRHRLAVRAPRPKRRCDANTKEEATHLSMGQRHCHASSRHEGKAQNKHAPNRDLKQIRAVVTSMPGNKCRNLHFPTVPVKRAQNSTSTRTPPPLRDDGA